ncbi:MAG: FecR domain-containing protein [Spirochaetes bacterium]|nr:FecR domain-containing protein [Spirochaetota bacterium]
MRSSVSDVIFYAVCTAAIAASSAGLYFDINAVSRKGVRSEIGTITYKERVVQRKYAGEVVWRAVDRSQPVYESDTVMTERGGEASIKLFDGTAVELGGESMIRLSRGENSVNINFYSGEIATRREEGSRPVQVRTLAGAAVHATGDISLKGNSNSVEVAVANGSAVVRGRGGEERTLARNERADVTGSNVTEKRNAFDVLTPARRTYQIATNERVPVLFAWMNAKAADIEIVRAERGESVIKKKAPASPNTVELAPGNYIWHVTAGGNEVSGRLVVLRGMPAAAVYPASNTIIPYRENSVVSFRWEAGRSDMQHTLEVARDRLFTDIIYQKNTAMQTLAADMMTAGMYFWRVRSKIERGDLVHETVSGIVPFTVAEEKKNEPPKALFPAPASVVKASSNGVVMSWDGEGGVSTVTVARDKDMNDIVYREQTRNNFVSMKREVPSGDYFWRVTDADGLSSEARSFHVEVPPVKAAVVPNAATQAGVTTMATNDAVSNATPRTNETAVPVKTAVKPAVKPEPEKVAVKPVVKPEPEKVAVKPVVMPDPEKTAVRTAAAGTVPGSGSDTPGTNALLPKRKVAVTERIVQIDDAVIQGRIIRQTEDEIYIDTDDGVKVIQRVRIQSIDYLKKDAK